MEAPEKPASLRCEQRKADGRPQGGCGCVVWRVTVEGGRVVELDPEPLDVAANGVGLPRRMGDEYACDPADEDRYPVMQRIRKEGGYRLQKPTYFAGLRSISDEDDETTLARYQQSDLAPGWRWYADRRPLSAALEGEDIHSEHYLTCPEYTLAAKMAKLTSRLAVEDGAGSTHRAKAMRRQAEVAAEHERLMGAALRTEDQRAEAEANEPAEVVQQCGKQQVWDFIYERQVTPEPDVPRTSEIRALKPVASTRHRAKDQGSQEAEPDRQVALPF